MFIRQSSEKGWEAGEAGLGGPGWAWEGPWPGRTPGGHGVASLLGGLFLPGGYLLTAPPGSAKRMQIHFRLYQSKNQNREKQMRGNG